LYGFDTVRGFSQGLFYFLKFNKHPFTAKEDKVTRTKIIIEGEFENGV
jgi:hypothetical protein